MGEELLRDPTNETLGVFRVFSFFFFLCGLWFKVFRFRVRGFRV